MSVEGSSRDNTGSATQQDGVYCRQCPSAFLCTGPASVQVQPGYWIPFLPAFWQHSGGMFEEDSVIVKC
eukprot:CAMPEP_0113912110 /NCGR_PEP_ID=MMETSP0780_2-20120614/28696_1 /TAXON_ID=652834 /ORGANISM="Palpitomonas bilix" /LENGTH=68 /DNA_ID=CAMNT_0000908935 /DNA_START=95 /DNA_END=298 /DNA_ORIENTATION=- /assembly_acc=CAM_ASM_000599